jgi:hypothetical protein
VKAISFFFGSFFDPAPVFAALLVQSCLSSTPMADPTAKGCIEDGGNNPLPFTEAFPVSPVPFFGMVADIQEVGCSGFTPDDFDLMVVGCIVVFAVLVTIFGAFVFLLSPVILGLALALFLAAADLDWGGASLLVRPGLAAEATAFLHITGFFFLGNCEEVLVEFIFEASGGFFTPAVFDLLGFFVDVLATIVVSTLQVIAFLAMERQTEPSPKKFMNHCFDLELKPLMLGSRNKASAVNCWLVSELVTSVSCDQSTFAA